MLELAYHITNSLSTLSSSSRKGKERTVEINLPQIDSILEIAQFHHVNCEQVDRVWRNIAMHQSTCMQK